MIACSSCEQTLPLLQRYVQLRSKILGISDLKMYDNVYAIIDTDYKVYL